MTLCLFLSADKAPPPASDRSEDSSDDSLMDGCSTNDISRLLPRQPASSSALRKQRGTCGSVDMHLTCKIITPEPVTSPESDVIPVVISPKVLTVRPLPHLFALLLRRPPSFRPPPPLLPVLPRLPLGRPPATNTHAAATNIHTAPIRNGSPPPKATPP